MPPPDDDYILESIEMMRLRKASPSDLRLAAMQKEGRETLDIVTAIAKGLSRRR